MAHIRCRKTTLQNNDGRDGWRWDASGDEGEDGRRSISWTITKRVGISQIHTIAQICDILTLGKQPGLTPQKPSEPTPVLATVPVFDLASFIVQRGNRLTP